MNVFKPLLVFFALLYAGLFVWWVSSFEVGVWHGDSMEPAYTPGDVVVSVAVDDPTETVEVGEVAIYDNGEIMVGHRVVRKMNGMFVFKGDNNTYTETVDAEFVERVPLATVEGPGFLTAVM